MNQENFEFKNIEFVDVDYSYSEDKNKILNEINIEIKKGDKIGIIGKSGSGKTTFLNLFCGLLECSEGNIKINSKTNLKDNLFSWQKKIAYVPQNVAIIDESILFNIALESDLNKINLDKINQDLKIVDLYDFIYNLENNISDIL